MGKLSLILRDVKGVRSCHGNWNLNVVDAPPRACMCSRHFIMPVQDISLMIKPLPAIFRWMGIGPVNLAALFQARVSVQEKNSPGRDHRPLSRSYPEITAKACRVLECI